MESEGAVATSFWRLPGMSDLEVLDIDITTPGVDAIANQTIAACLAEAGELERRSPNDTS